MRSWLKKNRPFVAVDFDGRIARLVQARSSASRCEFCNWRPWRSAWKSTCRTGAWAGAGAGDGKLKAKDEPLLMQVSAARSCSNRSRCRGRLETERPAMVRYQVEKELPFRVEEAVIDFALESHYDSNGTVDAAGLQVLWARYACR